MIKKIGEIPVGFKGKLYGFPFVIKAQYKIDGSIQSLIVSDAGDIAINGKDPKEKTRAKDMLFSMIKNSGYLEVPENAYEGSYALRMYEKAVVEVKKSVGRLIDNLYAETAIENKKLKSKPAAKVAPKPVVKKAVVKKAVVKAAPKAKAVPKVKTIVKAAVATKSAYKQTGSSNELYDEARNAMPPGKRRSASGKTYTETRKNRSDRPGYLTGVDDIKKEKIYGAFKYQSMIDRLGNDFHKYNVAPTILEISKIANKMIEEKDTHSVDIMVYDHNKMKWNLVSTKMKSNSK